MQTLNLSDLTPEERRQLIADAKAIEKKEKAQKVAEQEALEELAKESLPGSFAMLEKASQSLKEAKTEVFRNFENFLKMKIEVMGIQARSQRSHTITADGQSIKLGYRITDGYTDDASYGLEKVHRFLGTLAKDEATKKLVNSILRLLQRNGKGDLDSKKVLELKQIADRDFPETELQEGVEIIQKSYKPKLSKWFIEAWYVNGIGVECSIPLSITSVNLPEDLDLTFLLPQK